MAQNGTIFAPRNSQSAAGAQKPGERTRLYRDFLTPALHRRFTSAAGIVIAFCWAEAVFISDKTQIFWSWFPISVTGLRTLLLLIPCLSVFIARVANLHVGERNANSAAEAVLAQVIGAKSTGSTISTFGWYMWSGWFFGEIYVWSGRPGDNLSWIDHGRVHEKSRLNENVVFLRCLFVLLGLIQAVRHLSSDYDRVDIPSSESTNALSKSQQSASDEESSSLLARFPQPVRLLSKRLGGIFNRSLKLTVVGLLFVSLPTYFFILRQTAWSWAYFVGRMFDSRLAPSGAPPTGFVGFGQLIWQAFSASLMLGLLWEISNATFDVCVAQPPLKKGQPLTSEIKDGAGALLHRSKDPNGSLISGLKSKKEVPKSFAFWELYIVCTQFDARRKTVFTEVDRAGGSTWRQICDYCLSEVAQINQRIKSVDDFGRVIPAPPNPQGANANNAAVGLPKIATQGVRDDNNILIKPKQDFAHKVGDLAKSIGQSPSGRDPVATLQRSADQILPKEERERFVREQFAQANSYALKVLQTPIGETFRQTFACRANAVIFGTPYSSRTNVIHAVKALTKLATSSLTEAQYGGVSRDIPQIVRTFTEAIQAIERFMMMLKPHWTDVFFSERNRNVHEVREVLDVLKAGLEEIVLAFGEYAGELGLSKKEVREAKEASVRKAIMYHESAAAPERKRLPASSSSTQEMVQRRRM